MQVRRLSIEELNRDGQHLIDGYNEEAGTPGMGKPKLDMVKYPVLESVGVLHCFGAYDDNAEFIGGLVGMVIHHPHYADDLVFFIDLFYVKPESRRTGAGTALLSSSSSAARAAGCRAIIAGAQPGSQAFKLYSRLGTVLCTDFLIQLPEGS